jgi:hypothetical protein
VENTGHADQMEYVTATLDLEAKIVKSVHLDTAGIQIAEVSKKIYFFEK